MPPIFCGTSFNGAVINNGNGDGVIRSNWNYAGTDCLLGIAPSSQTHGGPDSEVGQLFYHLNASGLGNYQFTDAAGGSGCVYCDLPHDVYGGAMLVSCLDTQGIPGTANFVNGTAIIIGGIPVSGGNPHYNTGVNYIIGRNITATNTPAIPPSVASSIDTKIDDGIPNSGKVGVQFVCAASQVNNYWTPTTMGYGWANNYAPLVAATPPCNVSLIKKLWQ